MTQFQLSASLLGHENDVKGLVFPNSNTIGSVSRDCTLRGWERKDSGSWAGKELYKSNGYLNCVTFSRSAFVCGGKDAKLTVVSSESLPFNMTGHESNVCSLDSKDNMLISGSWDSSARVWLNDAAKYILDEHQSAVWDVKIVDDQTFLSCGADKKIILWKNNRVEKIYVGHEDVVRGLCLLDSSKFASCSNDGTIKIWGFDGSLTNTLQGHTNFVYQLARLSSDELVSVGEDGEVRVWNLKECIQAITLPAVSVWCVAVDQSGSGDFAVAGSDYIIRLFSRDENRWASQEEREQLRDSVANKVNTSDIDESQIKDPSVLQTSGKEGQVVMVRNPQSGSIEAHQFSAGQWIRVGEVVSTKEAAAKNNAGAKKELDGKEYDYIFHVNIEDGKPELPLPYNSDDNPYDSARQFLEKNELPMSYLDEVAQFITTNAVVNQTTKKAHNPYADRSDETPSTKPAGGPLKVIPHQSYVKLVQYQGDPIFKALSDKNSKQDAANKLSEEEMNTIRHGLNRMDEQHAEKILAAASRVLMSWSPDDMLPILDLFRIAVGYHPKPPTAIAVQIIFSTLDPDAPKHALLATRALVNLFTTETGRSICASNDVKTNALEAVHKISENSNGATAARNIAIASLMLNYAVLSGNDIDGGLALLRSMAFIGPQLNDSESRYRLTLAAGTIIANNPVDMVKQEVKELGLAEWAKNIETPDDRTKVLVQEVNSVL